MATRKATPSLKARSALLREEAVLLDPVGWSRAIAVIEQDQALSRAFLSDSPNYPKRKAAARRVFALTDTVCSQLLAVVKGFSSGMEIGATSMCFPRRFFKVQSVVELPHPMSSVVAGLLEDDLYLGLMSHLLLKEFAPREQTAPSDVVLAAADWFATVLAADRLLHDYNEAALEVPGLLFDRYFDHTLAVALAPLRIGAWKLGMCRSFLRNLHFCGLLLGVLLDNRVVERAGVQPDLDAPQA